MIVFIDIDGVMLPLDDLPRDGFPSEAIEALATLLGDNGRLIVHSTWRHEVETRTQACGLFEDAGLKIDGFVDHDEPSKNKAIIDWLDEHYGPEHWPEVVIIDDEPAVFVRGCRKIRPNPMIGLTPDDLRGCLCESKQDHPVTVRPAP